MQFKKAERKKKIYMFLTSKDIVKALSSSSLLPF